jgi:hypothetical protein
MLFLAMLQIPPMWPLVTPRAWYLAGTFSMVHWWEQQQLMMGLAMTAIGAAHRTAWSHAAMMVVYVSLG